MVKVTVNGKRQLTALFIHPTLLNPDDPEMAQDLVRAAVNKALEEMESTLQAEMQRRAGSMFNLPGMNLGG